MLTPCVRLRHTESPPFPTVASGYHSERQAPDAKVAPLEMPTMARDGSSWPIGKPGLSHRPEYRCRATRPSARPHAYVADGERARS
jgi:hypothetical protein